MKPYSWARDEYKGKEAVFLDANENPFETDYNRYPDPHQRELKNAITGLKGVSVEQLFLGNGSDEIIDLLIRSTCEPLKDNVIVFSPGYSMYEVAAAINNVEVRKVSLTTEFLPDWEELHRKKDGNTKIVFLCTPNNPTGKVIPIREIEELCRDFEGFILVDEAYIDFTEEKSAVHLLARYSQVVVLQTLSKAWGMAGLRLGICMADERLIKILNRVKAPYNISSLSQETAIRLLKNVQDFRIRLAILKKEREKMQRELRSLELFGQVYDSEANFILVTSQESHRLYHYLTDRRIVVRLRDIPPLICGGIRISIGTSEENEYLLRILKEYKSR